MWKSIRDTGTILRVYPLVFLSSSHQVGGDEFVRVPLVEGPAVREVRNRKPKRYVVRVGIAPAGAGVVDVLNERRVVVVVDSVAVDVAKDMPHLRHRGAGMEVGAFEVAALHPEVFVPAEGGVVQLLERIVGGH